MLINCPGARNAFRGEEAAVFLDALADFHASSWQHRILTDGSWGWPADVTDASRGLFDYFKKLTAPETWRQFIALPHGAAVPKNRHDRGAKGFLSLFLVDQVHALGQREPMMSALRPIMCRWIQVRDIIESAGLDENQALLARAFGIGQNG
jgi:hypothetical protein